MHMRRSLALVSGALLLTAPLAGCGASDATEQVNNIATGATDRDATVDVLNAVIVSAEEGSGTFVATFVNNDTSEAAGVEALGPVENGVGSDADQVTSVEEFSPITVEPVGLVNLADEEGTMGVEVTGDFRAGDVVSMRVELSTGELVDVNVPVVPNCQEFEGIDGPATDTCEIVHEGEGH